MLVVADQCAVRVGRKGSLSGSAETEEKRDVPLLTDVGRTVHRELRRIRQWQPVVHQREDSLLIFATIPSSKDNCLFLFDVENGCGLRVEIVAFPVLVNLRAAVNHCKVGLKIVQLFGRLGTDKHIRDEVLLPGHFVNEAHLLTGFWTGANVTIEDVALVPRVEIFHSLVVQFVENFRRCGLVDIVPVDILGGFRARVQDDPLVLR
mmetsp:Transcript_108788/g.162713  ORF Transcript_108788/g.162713 Transcript_108788/m.162713 type:complete len:206 (+) Transcript_108788:937-1554(+)